MNIPEGFVLVPADPIKAIDMGWAYLDAAREAEPGRDWAFSHSGYRAMVAAAPVPVGCSTCGGQGEIPSGEMQYQGEWQPPEPIMLECPDCAGNQDPLPAIPQPAAHLTIPGALEWDQLPGPVEIEYPEYSEQGMGCGLEDRGITDRYEAMRYGYDEALDQFARILDGYGPLYTHADTHGVVGTHGVDGESRADGESSMEAQPVPFIAGNYYRTQAGALVRFVWVHNEGTSYETMEDESGVNRYTRRDFGRVTGSPHDFSHPGNVQPLYIRTDSEEVESLRAQLASTEQSRRSFFDFSQDLEKRLASLKAFANELISASFEGGSFEGGDIQDIGVKHGLLRIEQRTEECGEVCACREYGFPAECYRKTDLVRGGDQ